EDLLERRKAGGDVGISADVAVEIIIQVLRGLSYAHNLNSPDDGSDLGIIHRDLKPGNLMISRHGHVKIMDFGIAKAKFQSATLTAQGQVRGTPIYMAPEQVTGKVLDGRTDQFAVATVLYELITGEQLFIGRNLLDIMRMVCKADVGQAVAKLERVDKSLAIAAQRMWSLKANNRFPDCNDAADALAAALTNIKEALSRGEHLNPSLPELPSMHTEPIFESASMAELPAAEVPKGRLQRLLGFFGGRSPAKQTRPQSTMLHPEDMGSVSLGQPRSKAKSNSPGPTRPQKDLPSAPPTEDEAGAARFGGGQLAPEPLLGSFVTDSASPSMDSELDMVFEDATMSNVDSLDDDQH
ncbi:MAG: protein kinase, partial [Myxococcota bacterium]|nr:protein kinase [Myxococcota bacterium]